MPAANRINPFNLDTIRQYDHCSDAYYITDESKHTESLFCDFEIGSKKERYFFSKNAPITSNWMELFGYGENEWYDTADKNNLMIMLRDCLYLISDEKDPDSIKKGSYLGKYHKDSFNKDADECLRTLNKIVKRAPALGFLYPLYFEVIKILADYLDGKINSKEATKALFDPLISFLYINTATIEYYGRIRAYVQDVFVLPFEKGIQLSPDKIAEHYKNYCELYHNNGMFKQDIYTNSTSERFPNAGIIEDAPDDPGWESYLEERRAYDLDGIEIRTLNQFAHIGIAQLIRDGRSIRKCKLCGKYFKVRYSSSQEYCTRIYKDSKFACNEYVSRRSAKDRFFEHPIHAEYNKAYNRLYARIRRGKVPKDTPLTTQLKALHDEYYERYEHTHQKDREAVWKEYIEKNKELLA